MSRFIDWPRYSRWTWIVAALLALLLLLLWFMGYGPHSGAGCCTAQSTAAAVAPATTGSTAGANSVATPATAARAMSAPAPSASTPAASAATAASTPSAATAAMAPAASGSSNLAATGTAPAHSMSTAPAAATAMSAATTPATTASAGTMAIPASAPPIAAATKPEDVQCANHMAAVVTFANGSSGIDAAGRRLLDAIAPCLTDGHYEVGGYTDNVGSSELNAHLSQARADAVRTYLIHHGAHADNLTATGHGEDHPVASNDSAEGRAKNRRIEFSKQ